jgi:cAMP-dependent protein kinase regulator
MAGLLRELFSGGKYEKELKELKRKALQDPKNHRLQVRIGDLLEKMGKRREALKIYRRVSERYARNGFLIQAIAVNKVILRLDPKETEIHDQIAELYARWGNAGEETQPWLQGGGMKDDVPPRLPPIPLFSDMKRDELSRVMQKIEAKKFAPGEPICKEGDPGNSIFIISQGRVSVLRQAPGKGRIVLNELKEGDFFGEFGFFSNSRRQATVEALDGTEVLEISKEDLEEMIREYPGISRVLFKFYRERVLDTLLATSPLFQKFSSGERREILDHLSVEEFPEGAIVLEEGAPGDCLYMIKSGEVEVFTSDGKGGKLALANLKEGDYFGEISLISGRPRTASVRVLKPAELVRLSKLDFDQYLARRPEAMKVLEDSLQSRLESKLRMLGVFRNSPVKEGMI